MKRKTNSIIHKYLYIATTFVVAMLVFIPASAQHTLLSLPGNTREGCLTNGLHYIILRNNEPAHRIEYRLVMKVGSIQESAGQKGCAHFLEHMAFGGTKHFPGRSLVHYLESKGMQYGIDINAVTGYDRTIYMFATPSEGGSHSLIDSSLLILRDWLDGIVFSPAKVESEKKVILEELKSFRYNDDFYKLKIGRGLWSDHIPLGRAEDIERVTPAALEQYYRKWYRPNLAALVIVGDVDPAYVEQQLTTTFASVKRAPANYFRTYPLQYDKGIQIMEVSDSLSKKTQVELIIPHRSVVERTLQDAQEKETGRLLLLAIAQRFRSRGIKADLSDAWYLGDQNHLTLSVEGETRAQLLKNITSAVAELNCLIENGWDKHELSEVRTRFCEQFAEENVPDNYTSSYLCDNFIDYFIAGDRYLTCPKQRAILKDSLSLVTSHTLQQLLKSWLGNQQRTTLVACRAHQGFGSALKKHEVAEAWRLGMQQKCKPFVYVPRKEEHAESLRTPRCLAVKPPFDPHSIASTKVYPALGVTEVKLRNGITLVLRPTQNADSTIYLTCFAPEGTGYLSDEAYPLLESTGGYMELGGIARVDGERLSNFLYKNNISLTITMENFWHGFMGMCPTEQSNVFFNLIYEKIHRPELRYKDFEEIKNDLLKEKEENTTLQKMLHRDNERRLSARIDEVMGAAVTRPHVLQYAAQLNLDSIAAYYNMLYTQTEHTTFVITGNFQCRTIIPQFAAIFGRMPAKKGNALEHERVPRLPQHSFAECIASSSGSQSTLDYLFYGYYTPSLQHTLMLKLVRDLIRNRLINVLREREGLVYSPYVSLTYEGFPRNAFYYDVTIATDSTNMKRVDALLKEIMHSLSTTPVSADELNNIKRSFLQTKQQTLDEKSPTAWRSTLVRLLKNGESIADFAHYKSCLEAITPEVLQGAIARWIKLDSHVLLYISNHKLEK